jgi:hypothetical protein
MIRSEHCSNDNSLLIGPLISLLIESSTDHLDEVGFDVMPDAAGGEGVTGSLNRKRWSIGTR